MSPKRKAAKPAGGGINDGVSSSSQPATPKRARKTKAEKAEKRMARFVKSPSVAVRERIQRAFQHRLYLIDKKMIDAGDKSPAGCEFYVLGATGNVYTVRLEQKPSCTCPDAAKGNTCKHFLFVMLRVLKLPQEDPRVWQKALLSNELENLLSISATNEGVLASQLVRQRFHEIIGTNSESGSQTKTDTEKGIQRDVDGDCPICYEAMAGDNGKPRELVVFCKVCGNNVHRDCFERWSRSKRSTGGRVTCIYCRGEWLDLTSKNSQNLDTDSSGYVNLASFSESHAGQDTSLDVLYPNNWEWIGSQSRRRRL